ncbi:hypothetical protein [Jannaschia formosa]|uniref:hypothetical protein n=1 Tax=Jannaschia formosa TaxID=2259592 RepID=UPI001074B0D9|nr:hypothetical protein [Jannaschia formosa]TFL18465.1 hypothetical protein DR046_10265 [Jannaschia formosa]
MKFRGYYDPHYKPDRSPSKYREDKRLDAMGAADAATFVAEFLAVFKPGRSGTSDPAAVFKALRSEARRLGKSRKNSYNSAKVKPKKKILSGQKTAPTILSHPWLKRKSSLEFLKISDGELMATYFATAEKIEAWRSQRAETTDQKRKAALAEQVQIQLEKRHDLLALIYHRAIGDEVETTPLGQALRSR